MNLYLNFIHIGIIDAPGRFIHYLPLAASLFEVILLSLGNGDKIRIEEIHAKTKIANLNQQIQKQLAKTHHLNQNLEILVAQKTRHLRSIMKNIKQGICTFTGENNIHPEHSDYLPKLFGKESFSKLDVNSFLEEFAISREWKSRIYSVIDVSIGDSELFFESNSAQLPKEVNSRSGSILDLDWTAILNSDGNIEGILVTVRDITRIREYERVVQQDQDLISAISQIIKTPREVFIRSFNATIELMMENKRLLLNKAPNEEEAKILFINMHTIKGTALSLNLEGLVDVAHSAESALAQYRKKEGISPSQLRKEFETVSEKINFYGDIAKDKLNLAFTDTKNIQFSHAQIQGWLRQPNLEKMRAEIINSFYKPAKELINENIRDLKRLAKDLEKPVPHLSIDDQGALLSPKGEILLRKILPHIFRNIMDHGLESAAERRNVGKKEAGTISMVFSLTEPHLQLTINDDGRGLDLKKLQSLAKKNRLILEDDKCQTIANLIFQNGISTANTLTEISGRGVGMSAIKKYITDEGGGINVLVSDPGSQRCPMSLIVTLPDHSYYKANSG